MRFWCHREIKNGMVVLPKGSTSYISINFRDFDKVSDSHWKAINWTLPCWSTIIKNAYLFDCWCSIKRSIKIKVVGFVHESLLINTNREFWDFWSQDLWPWYDPNPWICATNPRVHDSLIRFLRPSFIKNIKYHTCILTATWFF